MLATEVKGQEINEVDAAQVVGEKKEVTGFGFSLIDRLEVTDEAQFIDGDILLPWFCQGGVPVGEWEDIIGDGAVTDGGVSGPSFDHVEFATLFTPKLM